MKLLHCHADVTVTTVGGDLGPLQTSMMKPFEKKSIIDVQRGSKNVLLL